MEQTATTTQQTRTTPNALEQTLFALAVLALALAPTQWTFTVKGIPLHPAEPVLILAALVWAARWWRVRDTRSLPPLSHWALICAGALGVFIPGDTLQLGVVKEVAQQVLYLLVAVTVFRAVFTSPDRLRTAFVALLATTTLAVAFGVVQRGLLARDYQPDPAKRAVFADSTARLDEEDAPETEGPKVMGVWNAQGFHPCSPARALVTVQTPAAVSSTFGSWNRHGYHPSRTAYAGFLALLLPVALALLFTWRTRGVTVWFGLLMLGAAVSVLAGYLLPAILLGLLATGWALGARAARWTLGGVVAYLLVIAAVGGHQRTEVLQEPFRLRISAAEATYRYEDHVRHLKKFWGEQQAALNVLRQHPLFGVGAGRYQEGIGQAYDRLGKIEQQRLESDAQNGYLLTAVNTGLLGLGALLMLLGEYLGLARRRLRAQPGDAWAAAFYGALVALVLMTLVTNPWVRGTMMVIAALTAAIGNGATEEFEKRIQK